MNKMNYLPCFNSADFHKDIKSTPCVVPKNVIIKSEYTFNEMGRGPMLKNSKICDAPKGNPNYGKVCHVITYRDNIYYTH